VCLNTRIHIHILVLRVIMLVWRLLLVSTVVSALHLDVPARGSRVSLVCRPLLCFSLLINELFDHHECSVSAKTWLKMRLESSPFTFRTAKNWKARRCLNRLEPCTCDVKASMGFSHTLHLSFQKSGKFSGVVVEVTSPKSQLIKKVRTNSAPLV